MLMGSGLKWFGGKLFQTYKLSNQIWSFCLLQGIHWWKRICKCNIIKSEPMGIGSHYKFHGLEWPSQQEFEAVRIFMILQTIRRFSNSCICFTSRKIWALCHQARPYENISTYRVSILLKSPKASFQWDHSLIQISCSKYAKIQFIICFFWQWHYVKQNQQLNLGFPIRWDFKIFRILANTSMVIQSPPQWKPSSTTPTREQNWTPMKYQFRIKFH